MRINMFCRFTMSGVGRHARYVYDNLQNYVGDGLSVHHVDLDNKQALAEAIVGGRADDIALFFVTHDPKLLEMIKGKKILWCVFESTRIPTKLMQLIRCYDAVWTPSAWGRDVLITNGLSQDLITVVPEGVDTKLYAPQHLPRQKNFIFLSVAKYEKRKGIDELVDAFQTEFLQADYPDIALWLKADFPSFPERMVQLRAKTDADNRIKIFDGTYSDSDMALLYNKADAFVFPSRAEGFGLPCLEALSCGLPVITTNYSGQTEYLRSIDGLYQHVDYTMEDIVDCDFDYFFKDLYAGEGYGQWAQPDIGSLRQCMRRSYFEKEIWRQKAAQATVLIRGHFDWDDAVQEVLVALGWITSRHDNIASPHQ